MNKTGSDKLDWPKMRLKEERESKMKKMNERGLDS